MFCLKKKPAFFSAALIFITLSTFIISCSVPKEPLNICCSSTSDLYGILQSQHHLQIESFNTPEEAARDAGEGQGILITADNYPAKQVELSAEFFALVQSKRLRVYVEYPTYLPGIHLDKPIKSSIERLVVNSSFFKSNPDSLSILVANGLNYVPASQVPSHLVTAKVAGFDHAQFGLPEKTFPVLFELPEYSVLVSTTSLSRMVTGRFAPQKEWIGVWSAILHYLLPGAEIENINWTPTVSPTYGINQNLPAGYQKRAVKTGIEWYQKANMIVNNGREGSYEAIMSVIDEQGAQPVGMVKRGDCIGETAMAFATAGDLLNDKKYKAISTNLLDYYLVRSTAAQNEWADSTHGAYGLIPWGITNYAWYRANYGDDNAREMMGIMVSSALNKTDQWDTILMRCLLAQLRTTGTSGFRGDRIDLPEFAQNGWEYYYKRDIINMAPHFEAYLWACFLWAFDKTKDSLFLEKTEKAIDITMKGYPDQWSWTNGLAQEKARMILPLAWLVRVHDTPEHREYLNRMVGDLLKLQDSSGAIREELGDLKMGRFPPPQSNEAYGTNEASLIGKNGDKVSDLLYTTNFAFLGLHEAAAVTGDPVIKAAEDRLAQFLCRIQVYSPARSQLHGGWFRAFDYGRYEHWGCNADQGWGAWCIESGWTQGWITSLLALREMNTSVWDLTRESKVAVNYEQLKKKMLLSKTSVR
jgi:hypothetical protein